MTRHLHFVLLLTGLCVIRISGHGRLVDPPSRGSMWRLGFSTPDDYNDHELFCGGFERQWIQNNGRCGECGDPWDLARPRPHEAGGKYGTGTLAKVYRQGQIITAMVHLTANHGGWFEFRVCPTNDRLVYAKQSCLNKNVLQLADHSGSRYEIKTQTQRLFKIRLRLPAGLFCSHCVMQWHYTTGNNWGLCRDGKDKQGCGKQEVFRGCADIAIFEPGDVSYFKYLNLTSEVDLAAIISLQDAVISNDNYDNHNLFVDNEDGHHNLIVHHLNQDSERESEEKSNELIGDDLEKLDGDGDGIISIGGNFLDIETLKKHLLKNGLFNSGDKKTIKSEIHVPNTTTRSRNKFKSIRNRKKNLSSENSEHKYETYVTPLPPRALSIRNYDNKDEDEKSSKYASPNSFRLMDPLSSIGEPVVTTPITTKRGEFTVGPVRIHSNSKKNFLPDPESFAVYSSEVIVDSDDDFVLFKPLSKISMNTTPFSASTTILPDTIPELLKALTQIDTKSRPHDLQILRPAQINREDILQAVQRLIRISPHTTTISPTQVDRDNLFFTKTSTKQRFYPSIQQRSENSSFIRSPTFNFVKNQFSKNALSPEESVDNDFLSSIKHNIGSKSQYRKPTTKPSLNTRDDLLETELAIRNLNSQTQLFIEKTRADREKHISPRKVNSTLFNIDDIIPITSRALQTGENNLSKTIAFQVTSSKLRDTTTIDRILELKKSLHPYSGDLSDPLLLIII